MSRLARCPASNSVRKASISLSKTERREVISRLSASSGASLARRAFCSALSNRLLAFLALGLVAIGLILLGSILFELVLAQTLTTSGQELRNWVASQLSLVAITDEHWAILEEGGWVEDALENSLGTERRDLVDEARELSVGAPVNSKEVAGSLNLSNYEAGRAAAYAEYLAKLAAAGSRVRRFRRQVLKDELLTSEAAEEFLTTANKSIQRKRARIGRYLARIYYWEPDAAAWFVITGEPPAAATGKIKTKTRYGQGFSSETIVPEVPPWVSPETARKAYVEAQTRLRGRRNHKLGDRNLAVFRFVVERVQAIRPVTLTGMRKAYPTPQSLKFMATDEFGWPKMGKATKLVGPSLTDLHGEWNQKYPEGHNWYSKSPKTFSRDLRKAEKEIAHSLYNPRNKVDSDGS